MSNFEGLETLTFDLLASNGVTGQLCHGLPSCQFWACYALTYLRSGMGQTDGRTDVDNHCIMLPSYGGDNDLNLFANKIWDLEQMSDLRFVIASSIIF